MPIKQRAHRHIFYHDNVNKKGIHLRPWLCYSAIEIIFLLLLLLLYIYFFFTRGRYDPSGDIIVIIEYYCLEDQASSSIAEGKVPRKATRLNLWMAIDRR